VVVAIVSRKYRLVARYLCATWYTSDFHREVHLLKKRRCDFGIW